MAGFVATAFALMFLPAPAMADTVEIHDDSKVLNVAEVTNAASALPDPVRIYTVTRPTDNAAFTTWLESKGDSASNLILIGLNTRTQRLVCRSGNRSGVTQSALDTAMAAFETESRTGDGDETSALTAMLGSLGTSLRQAGVTARPDARPTAWSTTLGSGGKVHVTVTHSRNPFRGLIVWAVGSLFCLASLSLIAILRRRRSGRGGASVAAHPAPPVGPGYGPPPGQGYGPPAGQGYGPPAGQGYGPPAGQGYGSPSGQGYGPPSGPGYGSPAGQGHGPSAGQGQAPSAGPGPGSGASGPDGPPPADPPSGNPPYAAW
jgi:hypothetical protein